MSAEICTWPFGKTASALNFRGVLPALRHFKKRPVSDYASLLGHRNEKSMVLLSPLSLKNVIKKLCARLQNLVSPGILQRGYNV